MMATTLDITRRSLFGMVAAALAVKVLPAAQSACKVIEFRYPSLAAALREPRSYVMVSYTHANFLAAVERLDRGPA